MTRNPRKVDSQIVKILNGTNFPNFRGESFAYIYIYIYFTIFNEPGREESIPIFPSHLHFTTLDFKYRTLACELRNARSRKRKLTENRIQFYSLGRIVSLNLWNLQQVFRNPNSP